MQATTGSEDKGPTTDRAGIPKALPSHAVHLRTPGHPLKRYVTDRVTLADLVAICEEAFGIDPLVRPACLVYRSDHGEPVVLRSDLDVAIMLKCAAARDRSTSRPVPYAQDSPIDIYVFKDYAAQATAFFAKCDEIRKRTRITLDDGKDIPSIPPMHRKASEWDPSNPVIRMRVRVRDGTCHDTCPFADLLNTYAEDARRAAQGLDPRPSTNPQTRQEAPAAAAKTPVATPPASAAGAVRQDEKPTGPTVQSSKPVQPPIHTANQRVFYDWLGRVKWVGTQQPDGSYTLDDFSPDA